MSDTLSVGNQNFRGTALWTGPIRAKKFLKRFYATSVATNTMNTDYEGELKAVGERITIPQRPVGTIGTWSSDKTYTYPQLVPPAAKELVITEAPDFEFGINNIDKIQAFNKDFDAEALDEYNQKMRISIETTILNAAGALVDPSNTGNAAGKGGYLQLGTLAAPVYLTADKSYKDANGRQYVNVVKFLTGCMTALADNNIDPNIERFGIGCPMLFNTMANSSLASALFTGDSVGVIRKGPDNVGKVQGMNLWQTTLFNNTTTEDGSIVFPFLFGVKNAWSFAAQNKDFWSGELQNKAGWGYRGVTIYGWNVLIPTAIGCGYVSFDGSF